MSRKVLRINFHDSYFHKFRFLTFDIAEYLN